MHCQKGNWSPNGFYELSPHHQYTEEAYPDDG